MAGVKKCLGIDIGTDSVKMAEMAIDKGGVRIIRLVSAQVPVGASAMEAERTTASVAVIKNLIKTNKITTKNAAFSIAGQTVVVRHGQKVPRAPGPRLDQIIHFEARQLIPFPPEQALVEYQVFDTADPHEVEFLLAGMKRVDNQEAMRTIRRTGLRPVGLIPSYLALFNGQQLERYTGDKKTPTTPAKKTAAKPAKSGGLFGISFGGGSKKPPKATKKKGAKDETPDGEAVSVPEDEGIGEDLELDASSIFEEVRAYINIGARRTDIAITQGAGGKNVGFTRSLPTHGGKNFTDEILKRCQCDTFAQADEIKREKTAVLSGMFEIEADKEKYDSKACAAATAVCDRIIAEVRRTLDYFISQPYGMAVDAIVLSGGGASLPYLDTYIEERLGLPVTIAKTLGNERIKTPTQYSEGFDFAPYRVALGLASQGLGISPITIDFLPTDIRAMRDFSGQTAEIAVLAGLVAVMVFLSSQIGGTSIAGYRVQLDQYTAQINQLKPVKQKFEKVEADRKTTSDKLGFLAGTFRSRDFWLRFYADLQQVKPPEILITQVAPKPDYANALQWDVAIGGEAEQNSVVPAFVDMLKRSEYVKGVQFSRISNAPIASVRFDKLVYQFEVVAHVQDTGTGLMTRLAPELTPTPLPGAAGLGGMMGMQGMSPEQMQMMMMQMGMGGMPGMPGMPGAPGAVPPK